MAEFRHPPRRCGPGRAGLAGVALVVAAALGACSGAEPSTSSTSTSPTFGPGDAQPPTITPTATDTEGGSLITATPTAKGDQSPILLSLPGNDDGSCVDSSNDGQLRSGGFAGGDFDLARATFAATPKGTDPKIDLFFIPRHGDEMPGVTVRGRGASGATVEVTSKSTSVLDSWKFYPVQLTIPAAGRWELIVEAGPDRGCFAVDLSR